MDRKQKVTSLELAKELQKVAKENGFKLPESEMWWGNTIGQKDQTCWRLYTEEEKEIPDTAMEYYPAYDILNDLCVKYNKEMFGDPTTVRDYRKSFEFASKRILFLLQQNKKDEAEEYIWKHCLFNPKNKGG